MTPPSARASECSPVSSPSEQRTSEENRITRKFKAQPGKCNPILLNFHPILLSRTTLKILLRCTGLRSGIQQYTKEEIVSAPACCIAQYSEGPLITAAHNHLEIMYLRPLNYDVVQHTVQLFITSIRDEVHFFESKF